MAEEVENYHQRIYQLYRQLIDFQRRRALQPFFNGDENPGCQEADCFTSLKRTCLPYHCHYTMTKEKESLRPPLFTSLR